MITFPEKARQNYPNDSSCPSFSRPTSAGSPYMSHSASSSRALLRDHICSDSNPQTPRPVHLRDRSISSLSSFSDSTACPTPNPEQEFKQKHDSISIYKTEHNNSFLKYIESSTFNIETLDKNDDVDLLSPWKRRLYRLSPFFTFLAVGAYFTYYSYRIHCTVYAQRAYHKIYVMAWLFIAAEGCVACTLNI